MLRKFILIATVFLLFPYFAFATSNLKTTYPRLANYYFSWAIDPAEARDLARWDIIILDMEVARRTPEAIRIIRETNPNAVILAYITPSEIRTDTEAHKNNAPFRYELASGIAPQWYLRDAEGNRRSFWPGSHIMNITNDAPVVDGKRWNEYVVDFVVDRVLSSGLWDGVFYDNGWENITYFSGGAPDLNNDGVAEKATDADNRWREGLRTLYKLTRERAPDALVFENDGPLYAASVDGVMYENFPHEAWRVMSTKMKKIARESILNAPILNANTKNIEHQNDYRAMRFGLATALAHDSFYSFDKGDLTHTEKWWYDEYNVFLGNPRGTMSTIGKGIVQRDFEEGLALVNPADEPRFATLPGEFEKIIGTQDKRVNDGSIISEITLQGSDGIILRRRIEKIIGTPYVNGAFVRVFKTSGNVVRSGFFAYNKKYADGALVADADMNGDGALTHIEASGNELVIGSKSITPFGSQFSGIITFALGDIDGNGRQEILVAGENTGGGEVRIYRDDGELARLPFHAFGSKYKGGMTIAAGDVNGDGKDEIITGAGIGGGPEVRIFQADGKLLAPGFSVFDPRFQRGVRVAAGDVNGDGKDEIITGAGIGGGPHIRIFTMQGKLIGSFFAFDKTRRNGVTPIVVDVDGDGSVEILGATRDPF